MNLSNGVYVQHTVVNEIEKRQKLLKNVLATQSRYPIMNRGDKNSYDHFLSMQEAFQSQQKQADWSKKIGEHLLRLYDIFSGKLYELYIKLSEYDFENGCHTIEWCKEVRILLLDINEFPFHQTVLRNTLFGRPVYKYDYSKITNIYIDDNYTLDETPIHPTDKSYFSSILVPNVFPEHTFLPIFRFNAYSSNSLSTTLPQSPYTETETLIENDHMAYRSIQCRNVLNVLTEEWILSNKDNSLPGILLEYFHMHSYPNAYLWKLFDPDFFYLSYSSSSSSSTLDSENAQYLLEFMAIIFNWIQGVEQNRIIVDKEVTVIDSIIESSKLNSDIANSQLQLLGSFNDDQILSMIESGNKIKKQIDQLPTTTSSECIFTPHELFKF